MNDCTGSPQSSFGRTGSRWWFDTRTLMIILGVVACMVRASACPATVIAVPLLSDPVVIAKAPPVRLVAHGPHSSSTYRVTLEVENTLTTCSLVLAVPRETLRMRANSEPVRETDESVSPVDGAVMAIYDERDETASPVRRLKVAYARWPHDRWIAPEMIPHFVSEISVPPRTMIGVDLDFDLPREGIPERIKISISGLIAGCDTQSIDGVWELDFVAGSVLELMRSKPVWAIDERQAPP